MATIEFGKWPISVTGGFASHNFIILRGDNGQILREFNGGAHQASHRPAASTSNPTGVTDE
jgi:hypothetical protein